MHPFKDPIAPRERKSNRTFAAPTKEQATTGRFMQGGDKYGVGFRTPIGTLQAKGMDQGPIPMKSSCHDPNEI